MNKSAPTEGNITDIVNIEDITLVEDKYRNGVRQSKRKTCGPLADRLDKVIRLRNDIKQRIRVPVSCSD